MRSLYIDCDGVTFDTIRTSFEDMKQKKIDIKNDDAITNYYKNVDWQKLITTSGQINDSLQKIKLLIESQEFERVSIATHRCSYQEGAIKTQEFQKEIPGLQVITIPKKIEKHHALNAQGNILIDDALNKVLNWIADFGIGILFSQKVDHLVLPYEYGDNPYYITNNLLDILIVNNLEKEKTHRK